MSKIVEEIISEMLVELDQEYSEYQKLHIKFYGMVDSEAKNIYDMKVSLCRLLRKRILLREETNEH
jgi:hypothetical protein